MEVGRVGDQPGAEAGVKVVEGQGGNQGLLDGIEGNVMIWQPAEGEAFLKEIIEDIGKGREVRNEVLELVAKDKETPDGGDVGGDGKVRDGLEALCARLNAGWRYNVSGKFHRGTNLELLVGQDKPMHGTAPENLAELVLQILQVVAFDEDVVDEFPDARNSGKNHVGPAAKLVGGAS